jgi:predicted nuclease with TOPRIM domain
MTKEELKSLVEENLTLRKRMESLREDLSKLESRYEEVGQPLYWCRSREFLRSLLWYPQDLRKEYGKDPHFDDLVDTVIHSLKDHEHIEQRQIYTPKHLLRLFDEKVE